MDRPAERADDLVVVRADAEESDILDPFQRLQNQFLAVRERPRILQIARPDRLHDPVSEDLGEHGVAQGRDEQDDQPSATGQGGQRAPVRGEQRKGSHRQDRADHRRVRAGEHDPVAQHRRREDEGHEPHGTHPAQPEDEGQRDGNQCPRLVRPLHEGTHPAVAGDEAGAGRAVPMDEVRAEQAHRHHGRDEGQGERNDLITAAGEEDERNDEQRMGVLRRYDHSPAGLSVQDRTHEQPADEEPRPRDPDEARNSQIETRQSPVR